MDGSSQPLTTRILRRSRGPHDYAVYRAGLEWSLIDPIIIDSRDDLKSEARWRGRIEPFNHQVTNLINFCRRLPVTLLADDVGLGKTISAGLVASELISRRRVTGIRLRLERLLEALQQDLRRAHVARPGEQDRERAGRAADRAQRDDAADAGVHLRHRERVIQPDSARRGPQLLAEHSDEAAAAVHDRAPGRARVVGRAVEHVDRARERRLRRAAPDRKSTRLNSSHRT